MIESIHTGDIRTICFVALNIIAFYTMVEVKCSRYAVDLFFTVLSDK